MKCEMCGKKVEALCICEDCLGKVAGAEQARKIRNIANILSLTANTDMNIKNAMESLLDIAGELEVLGNGKKQEKEKGKTEKKIRAAGQNRIEKGGTQGNSTAESAKNN